MEFSVCGSDNVYSTGTVPLENGWNAAVIICNNTGNCLLRIMDSLELKFTAEYADNDWKFSKTDVDIELRNTIVQTILCAINGR